MTQADLLTQLERRATISDTQTARLLLAAAEEIRRLAERLEELASE